MESPLLLSKLQTALECLYGSSSSNTNTHEAHEFLLAYKSSNNRRNVASRIQSQRDRIARNIKEQHQIVGEEESDFIGGSIYLSALALILQSRNSHERIFSAQTLNHRCRSIKLVETLDIEAEDGIQSFTNLIHHLQQEDSQVLTAWLDRYVPMLVNRCGGTSTHPDASSRTNSSICNGVELLALVLQRHSSSLLSNINHIDGSKECTRYEEEIKGTLLMLTLAVALYVSAFTEYEEEHLNNQQIQQHGGHVQVALSPWANTVLYELGSAMSITSLRIRYKPLKDKYATPSPEQSSAPLIDMLVNAVNLVKESAEFHLAQKIEQHNMADHQHIHQAHQHAIKRSVTACIKALPETVLLPLGENNGHRTPSIDRASLRAASSELRSSAGAGMDRAWQLILELEQRDGINQEEQDASVAQLLECCEAWARYVVIPLPVIDVTVGSLAVGILKQSNGSSVHSRHHQKAQAAAFQYLVSIFESASPSLTTNDVLTAALGVGSGGEGGKKNNKKKNGNKSKKRKEKRLGRAMTITESQSGSESVESAAEMDLLQRKNTVCVAAAHILGVSLSDGSIIDDNCGLRQAATSLATSTHAICSTVASLATSTLPHLLYLERNDTADMNQKWRSGLFSSITLLIRRMCASQSRDVRSQAYEPLMILHGSLNEVSDVSLRMEQVAIDAISECSLALATSCGYPPGYFDYLANDNDEELEIERNDVRDVARTVSTSIHVLERIVDACYTVVKDLPANDLPQETVIHLLSSLAKPLNALGKGYKQQKIGCDVMSKVLLVVGNVCDKLNFSFDSGSSISELLPLSRLVLMGIASLSPMLDCLIEVMNRSAHALNNEEIELFSTLKSCLRSSLHHAMLSAIKIPEIVAASTLQSSRYDIRGAMRGPGGEDHVACIALLRLSHESENLARAILVTYGETIFLDLSTLHRQLKNIEVNRGVGVDYGIGVCPVSRRIILKVISHLSLIKMNNTNEVQAILQELLQVPLNEIVSFSSDATLSAEKLYVLCEASFDLSFYSPSLVTNLFNNNSNDLAVIFDCIIAGYSQLTFTVDSDDLCYQWARLRGAAYCVIRSSLRNSITECSASIISALIKAECDAAMIQCNQGPDSGSNFFIDNVVGEEFLHAGCYILLVRDCIDRIAMKKDNNEVIECHMCLSVLRSVAPVVIPLLVHHSPEATAHVDPRPTIAESWFLTLKSFVSVCQKNDKIASNLEGIECLFADSLGVVMSLIFLKDLGTKTTTAPEVQRGMTLDGAQTLAMTSFSAESLKLGPSVLSERAIDTVQVADALGSTSVCPAIFIAALLRAVSGALPPWSVEDLPDVFESVYISFGSNPDDFAQLLSISTKLKSALSFGGVRNGELLAGRYLDVSDNHIKSFISQTKEVCNKGSWKKLKVILKSTCGGKKKESGFNLKPHFTTWDSDRL